MQIDTLPAERLGDAAALLRAALPHDLVEPVAAEKLFGDNGARATRTLGACINDELVGVLALAGRWIKLLAVDERHRRRGIGSALLAHINEAKTRVMDHPGNYLSPGLDIRYGEARAFFERRGFRALGEVENIRAPLDGNPLIDRELEVPGYTLERGDARVLDWIASAFHPVWAFEVKRALSGPRRAVHVAMQQNSYVAFAAADGNNQGLGWFGPAGTDAAHRGKRLGEALLLRCLRDVRGLPEAGVIAWIGPKEFYRKNLRRRRRSPLRHPRETMRAIILAAGLGTRLGTLSDERPKPLLPVCDIPLIRYALALLRGHGITEVVVNLHHRGDLIQKELGDEVIYSHEEVILGTGGGLAKMGDWLTRGGRDSFFVVNGKILVDADLHEMRARHERADASATMLLRETADAKKWGAIEVDDGGRVTRIIGTGKPGKHVCMFTGVHLVAPRLLQRLPPDGESDSIRQAYLPALEAGEAIEGVLLDGYFHEHSTPERYLQGNWNALEGRAVLRHPPGPLAGVDPSAHVGGTLHPPVLIGKNAVISEGASVGPNVVVGAGARVEAGARLERVVIWPGSIVSGELRDTIVTPRGAHKLGGANG